MAEDGTSVKEKKQGKGTEGNEKEFTQAGKEQSLIR